MHKKTYLDKYGTFHWFKSKGIQKQGEAMTEWKIKPTNLLGNSWNFIWQIWNRTQIEIYIQSFKNQVHSNKKKSQTRQQLVTDPQEGTLGKKQVG